MVTDAGLAHLEDRTDLEALALRETAITDAGLVHLKGLESISRKRLFLGGTQITDDRFSPPERDSEAPPVAGSRQYPSHRHRTTRTSKGTAEPEDNPSLTATLPKTADFGTPPESNQITLKKPECRPLTRPGINVPESRPTAEFRDRPALALFFCPSATGKAETGFRVWMK